MSTVSTRNFIFDTNLVERFCKEPRGGGRYTALAFLKRSEGIIRFRSEEEIDGAETAMKAEGLVYQPIPEWYVPHNPNEPIPVPAWGKADAAPSDLR